MKIIFASTNIGKTEEVKKIMYPEFNVESMSDYGDMPEIIENGDTYFANALIKAKTIYKELGLPVIADDSGLSVEQLGGAPGVHSARFAGIKATYEDNNKKVLELLEGLPQPHMAKFICCAIFYDGNIIMESTGELKGEIISPGRGINGFGYDPIFLPAHSRLTLAEMPQDEKNRISHRAAAFSNLKFKLKDRRDEHEN